jgi:predicted N-formylglutamate amidohydrolase
MPNPGIRSKRMTTVNFLEPDDPPPVKILRARGRSVFVLTADHAGRAIPRRLGTLGLDASSLDTHIAWDIGIGAVARLVSAALDAPLLTQRYSRLVIDCNRDPSVESSIPLVSEVTAIPGNASVTPGEAAQRRRCIFNPYHSAIHELLDRRAAAAVPAIMVALHSMTDVYRGVSRPMHTAVLYDRDARFARCVLTALREQAGISVAENEPYFVSPQTDYTIPHHAEGRLPYVEIEVRQDLIGGEAGQREWSQRLTRALLAAHRIFKVCHGRT